MCIRTLKTQPIYLHSPNQFNRRRCDTVTDDAIDGDIRRRSRCVCACEWRARDRKRQAGTGVHIYTETGLSDASTSIHHKNA